METIRGVVCPAGHPMFKYKEMPNSYNNPEFAAVNVECDDCGTYIMSTFQGLTVYHVVDRREKYIWHCDICDFDICARCAQTH